jgi:hypothetical protein
MTCEADVPTASAATDIGQARERIEPHCEPRGTQYFDMARTPWLYGREMKVNFLGSKATCLGNRAFLPRQPHRYLPNLTGTNTRSIRRWLRATSFNLLLFHLSSTRMITACLT